MTSYQNAPKGTSAFAGQGLSGKGQATHPQSQQSEIAPYGAPPSQASTDKFSKETSHGDLQSQGSTATSSRGTSSGGYPSLTSSGTLTSGTQDGSASRAGYGDWHQPSKVSAPNGYPGAAGSTGSTLGGMAPAADHSGTSSRFGTSEATQGRGSASASQGQYHPSSPGRYPSSSQGQYDSPSQGQYPSSSQGQYDSSSQGHSSAVQPSAPLPHYQPIAWVGSYGHGMPSDIFSGSSSSGSESQASDGHMRGSHGQANRSAGGTTTTTTGATTTSAVAGPNKTLYCWSLMMPWGDELALMKTLLSKPVGIFTCDQYSVFTDGDVTLSPGPPVRIGTTDVGSVHCNYGGRWHLALNSEVFIKVWKKIFDEQKFAKHDWTVKVDPDAVLIPERLKMQVADADGKASVYLNNCDQGLHGPIEVISQGGMKEFHAGIEHCKDKLEHEFWEWGEDVFLRHCLGLLKVNRVDNFKLLSEDRCMYENPPRDGCYSGKVAFHPFKTSDVYLKCLDQAGVKVPTSN